ncbi:MAG TPA: hypothetical protein VHK24_00305, partial [Steroidobacter sp.]|nr:hypothetical protein [Steroidobacter sp.]
KLDRLRIIELLPQNRVRVLVSRHFAWRAGGPVQNYIHQKLLREFLGANFSEPQEDFMFHGGSVTQTTLAQLKRVLQNASRECAEIMDRDRSFDGTRSGAAFLLALAMAVQRFCGVSSRLAAAAGRTSRPPPTSNEGSTVCSANAPAAGRRRGLFVLT